MIGNQLTGGTPSSSSVVFVLSVSIFTVMRTFICLMSKSGFVVVSSGVGSSASLSLGILGALKMECKDSFICDVEGDDVDDDGPGVGSISDVFSVWYCTVLVW